jgi:hypothetical protein
LPTAAASCRSPVTPLSSSGFIACRVSPKHRAMPRRVGLPLCGEGRDQQHDRDTRMRYPGQPAASTSISGSSDRTGSIRSSGILIGVIRTSRC